MKILFLHLAAELVKALTAQSSAEAEPTTLSAQSSTILLYVQKIIVNSQASDWLHEHDLLESRVNSNMHTPHPQKKKTILKIDNLRANILA